MQVIFRVFETHVNVTCEGLWDPIDVTRAIQEVKVQAELRDVHRAPAARDGRATDEPGV
jgi:hypothetical protein